MKCKHIWSLETSEFNNQKRYFCSKCLMRINRSDLGTIEILQEGLEEIDLIK